MDTQTRTSKELEQEKAKLIAEAEQLQTRSRTEALSPEEDARLEACITGAEELEPELLKVRRSERLAEQKVKLQEPSRPAPRVHTVPAQYRSKTNEQAEALQLWLRSFTRDADRSSEAHYRCQRGGFSLGQQSIVIPCEYTNFNLHKRYLSKGGANLGAELMPTTYSSQVTEYLTYFSPLLGILDSETTADGNPRVYFKFDDTALKSTRMDASGGTEIAPTIPDVNVATDDVNIPTYDITSGYHKITWQALRDSAVDLQDKVAKAIGHAHSRKIEDDVINGDGSGDPQGLLVAASSAGSNVAAWDSAAIETLEYSIPKQYRTGSVFLASHATTMEIRQELKDDIGRSLFDRSADVGQDWDTLFGYKFIESSYMDDDTLLFFNPSWYKLRLVAGQTLQTLVEKFAPHTAYVGIMSFGGAWLGPNSAIKKLGKTPGSG